MPVRNRHVAARSLLVATCLLVAGCGDSDATLTFNKVVVTPDQLNDALAGAEQLVGGDVTCWARTKEASDTVKPLTGKADCGPTSGPYSPWAYVDLGWATSAGEDRRLIVEAPSVYSNGPLEDPERLYRPDGQVPPTDEGGSE